VPAWFTTFALQPKPLSETENSAARRIGLLTPQQFAIAMWLTNGLQAEQIAVELGLDEASVKALIATIMRKLNVQNYAQVAQLVKVLDFEGLTGAEVKLADKIVRSL